jgi:hypothetical protein
VETARLKSIRASPSTSALIEEPECEISATPPGRWSARVSKPQIQVRSAKL